MVAQVGGKFGTFNNRVDYSPGSIKPITTEFSRGSVPNSIVAMDRESAWARWRRGYEIAVAVGIQKSYNFPFRYTLPVPEGTSLPPGNDPVIIGVLQGFPTSNREFGIHWTGCRVSALLRFDNVFDSTSTRASVASYTEDANYWYVTLAGTWSPANPLPAPLYIPGVGGGQALKPLIGEVVEDRVLTPEGIPITAASRDPATDTRYGYVQSLLVDIDQDNGVLKLQKNGSFESTLDGYFVTPATRPPAFNRFLILGSRYACTCQDFSRRSYADFSKRNEAQTTKRFPYTRPAALKFGRHEILTDSFGNVNNNVDTELNNNRDLELTFESVDNPGLFRDFGGRYLRNTSSPGASEGPATFVDYKAKDNKIISFSDYWSPLLDEMRYCKHIYALRFQEGILLPEPSDLPVEMEEGIVSWEQRLTKEVTNIKSNTDYMNSVKGLSYMDMPPKNLQSPQLLPMLQKLLNIPASFIRLANFSLQNKDGSFT